MSIKRRIENQKDDIRFIVCVLGKKYIWKSGATITDVEYAKRIFIESYEKYEYYIEQNNKLKMDKFAFNMLEGLPKRNEDINKQNHSYIIKVCLSIAYYFELLVEEITGKKANKDKFIYGESVDTIRDRYYENMLSEIEL